MSSFKTPFLFHRLVVVAVMVAMMVGSFSFAQSEPAEIARTKCVYDGGGSAGLVNIAPRAKVTSTPYGGHALGTVVDGWLGSVSDDSSFTGDAPIFPDCPGAQLPVSFEFRFPRQVEIKCVRLYQHLDGWRGYASEYVIKADTKGDGSYDVAVFHELKGKAEQWMTHRTDGVKAWGLRFEPMKGEKGRYGCRSYPVLGEFEIYSPDSFPAEETVGKSVVAGAAPAVLGDGLVFAEGGMAGADGQKQILRGYMENAVLMGWNPDIAPGTYESSKAFQRMLTMTKQLKCNSLQVYMYIDLVKGRDSANLTWPTNEVLNALPYVREATQPVLWPSSSMLGYRYNILSEICDAVHKQGIKMFVDQAPAQAGEGYPYDNETLKFPCVFSSDFFRKYSTATYEEVALAGADGCVFGGDECHYSIHGASKNPPPSLAAKFRDRYGYERPPETAADTECYRKWILLQYQLLGELFKNWNQRSNAINKDFSGSSLFYADNFNCCARTAFGICEDIIGAESGIEAFGTDPYWNASNFMGHYLAAGLTKRLSGAAAGRKAYMVPGVATFKTRNGKEVLGRFSNPVMVYGLAASMVMNGAKGLFFYRGDYCYKNYQTLELNPSGEAVRDFNGMLVSLERLGLADASPPKKIAFLHSRASEDWWQLARSFSRDGNGNTPPDMFDGWIYQMAAMEVLFREGYPFDLFFLDQPQTFEGRLKDYPLVIIPFPYSISPRAADVLRQLAAAGTKILIVRQDGGTDEFGTPYPEPALRQLIDDGGGKGLLARLMGEGESVVDLECALSKCDYREFSGRLVGEVDRLLGDKWLFKLHRHGKDVEASLLELPDGSALLWMQSWEGEPTEVEAGLRVGRGAFKIDGYGLGGSRRITVDGGLDVPGAKLERFACKLAPYELKVLHIKKQNVEERR